MNTNHLLTVEFLDSLCWTVVTVDDPNTPVCPDWLTQSEAESIANDATDATGVQFIAVHKDELEAQS